MANRILVASYSTEVYSLIFDSSKSVSTLTADGSVSVGHHPSWIECHPSDPSLVFAALETTEGKIVAIKYDDCGKASVVGEAASGGADPCSLTATKHELFVANYSSGTVTVLPIASHPPYFLRPPATTQLHGSGPNAERQGSSHAHQVLLNGQHEELLVADLGADCVCRFKKQGDTWKIEGQVSTYEPGSGPRHMAFYDGDLYTLLELSSSISKHRFPPLPAEPSLIAVRPTMANPPTAPHDMLAAELLIPKPNSTFSTPYAYISNRNDPSPEGDTIAIFSIAGDTLDLIAEIRTGLKHLRGMVFGGEDDKWLVAGGAQGGGVKVFERIDGGKGLRLLAENTSIESPTGFLWV
ncbi:putative isomerase YbhE [Mycena rebaudengoi]|nr:putative isomerase YbhE [Mycena rebaudengoi]